ncbi:hypothetical protein NEUTE1DRAFT_118173, partial [Neurospora tetrasperma FGSC 2508]
VRIQSSQRAAGKHGGTWHHPGTWAPGACAILSCCVHSQCHEDPGCASREREIPVVHYGDGLLCIVPFVYNILRGTSCSGCPPSSFLIVIVIKLPTSL